MSDEVSRPWQGREVSTVTCVQSEELLSTSQGDLQAQRLDDVTANKLLTTLYLSTGLLSGTDLRGACYLRGGRSYGAASLWRSPDGEFQVKVAESGQRWLCRNSPKDARASLALSELRTAA